MGGLVCQCTDTMMASCDVDEGGSLIAMLLLCMALAVWAWQSLGCCDGYESESDEETDASRSMFS
jgi:hypothetical protein